MSSAAVDVTEGQGFTVTVELERLRPGAVSADVVVSDDLADDSPQTVSWTEAESGTKDADFTASLVDGDQVGTADIEDAGGMNGAVMGDPASVSVTIRDSAPAPYSVDTALAEWPVEYAGNEPDAPIELQGTLTEVTVLNDTDAATYLGAGYDQHRIIFGSAGTFNNDAYLLQGIDKEVVFEDGVNVGRIEFADAGAERVKATYSGTPRNHTVAWFGPFYGSAWSHYDDILLDGVFIDINDRFPLFNTSAGQAWQDCNRVALISTFLGHYAYGCVPIRSRNILIGNTLIERTTGVDSSNVHGLRTEHTQNLFVVDSKIDHTFDVVGAGTALRLHYGATSQAGQASMYNVIKNVATKSRGALQVKVNNSGQYAFPHVDDKLQYIWLEGITHQRIDSDFNGQPAILLGYHNGEGGETDRLSPQNLTQINNKAYSDGVYTRAWATQTEDSVSPGDWGTISGNQSSVSEPHLEFDNWTFQA